MTEDELVKKIIKLALKHDALVHHCPDSRRCQGSKGFPDLVITGPGGVIFAECKSQTGDEDPDQQNWSWSLSSTAVHLSARKISHVYYLWRPENLESGEIEMLIRMITLN